MMTIQDLCRETLFGIDIKNNAQLAWETLHTELSKHLSNFLLELVYGNDGREYVAVVIYEQLGITVNRSMYRVDFYTISEEQLNEIFE